MKNLFQLKYILKIKRATVILVMVCGSMVTVHAQISESSDQLIGTWTFDSGLYESKLDSKIKTHLDTIPTLKSDIRSLYIGRKESFNRDGTYSVQLANGWSDSGSWSYQNKNIIAIVFKDGATIRRRIVQLTQNRLHLDPIGEGNSKSIIQELHFTKN